MRGPDSQQMMQVHQALRTAALNALTPAHKQLLATVAGQLAVADTPDVKAAAAELDAALSNGEKQAILAAAAQAHDQMKAQREQTMQAWQSAHPDASPRPMRSPGSMDSMHAQAAQDPGMILLMVAAPPMMMDGGSHHPRP